MADRPAVDASPLIFLARARLLDLLQLVASELVVPQPDRVMERALRMVGE